METNQSAVLLRNGSFNLIDIIVPHNLALNAQRHNPNLQQICTNICYKDSQNCYFVSSVWSENVYIVSQTIRQRMVIEPLNEVTLSFRYKLQMDVCGIPVAKGVIRVKDL